MYCEGCGKELNIEDKFCIHCGTPIKIATFDSRPVDTGFPVLKFILILGGIIGAIALVVYVWLYLPSDESISIPEQTTNDLVTDYESPDEEEEHYSFLAEMEPTLEPLGYFTEPELYDDENIALTDWLSLIEYYPSKENASQSQTRQQFVNQRSTLASVVKIVCEDEDYIYYGSGTNITDDGMVITNHHVIEDADEGSCIVGFPDPDSGLIREVYWAKIIIDDEEETGHDLAILSIEDPVFDEELNIYGSYDRLLNNTFPAFELTDSCSDSPTQLGDDIFVLGYPPLSGGALTITNGIVSSLYSQDGYIVTSAKIVSGNSGGTAVDRDGCYVGVPTAVYKEFGSEQFGEIIDAAFVGEFIEAAEDDIESYLSE